MTVTWDVGEVLGRLRLAACYGSDWQNCQRSGTPLCAVVNLLYSLCEIARCCAGFYDGSQCISLLPYPLRGFAAIENFLTLSVLENSPRITNLPADTGSCDFASSVPISLLFQHNSTIFVVNRRYEYGSAESSPDGGQRSVRPSVQNRTRPSG